jgi:hypothetical protein
VDPAAATCDDALPGCDRWSAESSPLCAWSEASAFPEVGPRRVGASSRAALWVLAPVADALAAPLAAPGCAAPRADQSKVAACGERATVPTRPDDLLGPPLESVGATSSPSFQIVRERLPVPRWSRLDALHITDVGQHDPQSIVLPSRVSLWIKHRPLNASVPEERTRCGGNSGS